MKLDPEEVRRKARTARENCLKTSKGEEYIKAQTALAKKQCGKLLELCPNDMEAKLYCVYYEANDAVSVKGQHEPATKKMLEALDVFAEDLKTSSLPLEEIEALVGDITTRVIVLAKGYNEQGVAINLLQFYMSQFLGREQMLEDLTEIDAEFMSNTALTARMGSLLMEYPAGLKSTAIRASIVVALQSSLELFVESPSFPLDDYFESKNQKLNSLLNGMEVIAPNSFHYIPLPEYKWCDYEAFTDLRKYVKELFDHSRIGKKIKQHNAKVRALERDSLRKINRERTKKYWEEHPDRPKELNDEMEKVRQTIRQNESKIEELNQQCTAAVAECDDEPIPASEEKEKLRQQLNALEAQQATLGFFQFSAKKQVKSDLLEAQAAYDQARENEFMQEKQKKEKKRRIVEGYQQKVEQIEEDNENLNKRFNSLRKELDNPLGLHPM